MARVFERYAVALPSSYCAEETVALARRAEELGYDSFWLAEIYYFRSIAPLAALAAQATSRIKIGQAIVPTHTRHPTLVAMEAAALDEISNGRFIVGLGAARVVANHLKNPVSLVGALRDSLPIIRGLLDGEEVAYDGKVYSCNPTQLGLQTRKGIPIHVGAYAHSPKMLALTGAMADGAIFSLWSPPHMVRLGKETVAEAAIKAGRDPSSIEISAQFILSVDENAQAARDACREIVAFYAQSARQTWLNIDMVTREDLEPVVSALESGGLEAGTKAVTDKLLEKIAVAGDPRYCRDRFKEYIGTGLDFPMIYGALGPDPAHALEIMAKVFSENP
jgi:alkanesulfonate monooxygenase SsuD/methylene tetrahydromethanopterin reductase-like flavin-dependent oxidoreductase (luciferase family)